MPRCRPRGRLGDHLEPARLQRGQRGQRRLQPVGRKLGAQDARELSPEMGHPALQPVATVRGDHAGHQLHEAGAIGAEQGQHEIGHAGRIPRNVKTSSSDVDRVARPLTRGRLPSMAAKLDSGRRTQAPALLLAFAVALPLAGCSPWVRSMPVGRSLSSKPPDCPVREERLTPREAQDRYQQVGVVSPSATSGWGRGTFTEPPRQNDSADIFTATTPPAPRKPPPSAPDSDSPGLRRARRRCPGRGLPARRRDRRPPELLQDGQGTRWRRARRLRHDALGPLARARHVDAPPPPPPPKKNAPACGYGDERSCSFTSTTRSLASRSSPARSAARSVPAGTRTWARASNNISPDIGALVRFGHQLLDVDAAGRQQLRDLADDPGAIKPEELEVHACDRRRRRSAARGRRLRDHLEAPRLQRGQRLQRRLQPDPAAARRAGCPRTCPRGRVIRLSSQLPPCDDDDARHHLHQARAIGADQREYQNRSWARRITSRR